MHYVNYDSRDGVQSWIQSLSFIYKIIQRESVQTQSFTRSYLGTMHSSIYIHTKEGDLRILFMRREYFLIHFPLRQDKTEAKSNDKPTMVSCFIYSSNFSCRQSVSSSDGTKDKIWSRGESTWDNAADCDIGAKEELLILLLDVWSRRTPRDAVLSLDPKYINMMWSKRV